MAMKFRVKSRHAKRKPIPKDPRFWAGTAIVIAALILIILTVPTTKEDGLNETVNETTENVTEPVVEEPEEPEPVVEMPDTEQAPRVPSGSLDIDPDLMTADTCDATREFVYQYFIDSTDRILRMDDWLAGLKNRQGQIGLALESLEEENAPTEIVLKVKQQLSRTDQEIRYYTDYIAWAREEKTSAKDLHDRIEQRCTRLKMRQ